MTAKLMPGAPVADAVFADLEPRIEKLIANGHTPGLGTLLVGDDAPSARYVAMKQRKAEELGCRSPHIHLPQDASQSRRRRGDPRDERRRRRRRDARSSTRRRRTSTTRRRCFELDPDKDVDGMHPVNLGRLALGVPGPVSCTPAGIEALLAHYEIPVAGREVCIVGRGITIGRPLALLLSQKRPTANAAVTVVHTGVTDWPRYTQRAEIVVAAAGVPGIIQPEHLTPGRDGGRRRCAVRRPQAATGRRRGVRGGGRRDHAARRWCRADDDRDAVPQPRRGRGASRGRNPVSR